MEKDYAAAFAWFKKAADQGNPTAQFNIGLMYAGGAGVKADPVQAGAWYRTAALQGQAAALTKLIALLESKHPGQTLQPFVATLTTEAQAEAAKQRVGDPKAREDFSTKYIAGKLPKD